MEATSTEKYKQLQINALRKTEKYKQLHSMTGSPSLNIRYKCKKE